MKKWYCFSFSALIATFILEILPTGVVLLFLKDDGSIIRGTFSYFDMTPFGNANFGPFPTAIFSSITLLGVVFLLFLKKPSPKLNTAMIICNIVAFLFSMLPVLQDKRHVTDLGIIISALLLVTFLFLVLARIKIRKDARNISV